MKITIEPTSESIDGVGRIWIGVTDSGVRCKVLVKGIATDTLADRESIDAELASLPNRKPFGLALLVQDGDTSKDGN